MNKNTLFTLLVLLLTSFISVNASENKAIDIPAAVWQSNKLTAYRLEVLDNLLGERGVTDERIGSISEHYLQEECLISWDMVPKDTSTRMEAWYSWSTKTETST